MEGYVHYGVEKAAPYAKYLDSKPKTRGWWEFEARKLANELSIDLKGIIKE